MQGASPFLVLAGRAGSLVIERTADGPPLWRHLGAHVSLEPQPPFLEATRSPASFSADVDRPLSIAPTLGDAGDFPPIISGSRGGRLLAPTLEVEAIEALPHELQIQLVDRRAGLGLRQIIRLDGDSDLFVFNTEVANLGEQPLSVESLSAAVLPIASSFSRLRAFRGRHGAEFREVVEPMPGHTWLRLGREGLPGHAGPPGLFLLGEGAGWHAGEVLGAQLAWSGSHRVEVARVREGFWALLAGEAFAPGEVTLGPGETLCSPDLLVACSGEGLNGASQAFHAAVRARMTWPGGRMRPRPVHLNSWEGLYFDQDEAAVMALAQRAAALGVERFVLDDGWFRGRSYDRAGLGDWTPDPVKYPRGLGPVAARVAELGMEFGLWVEPEMVNPDSDLYRLHPDWALGASLSTVPTARHQLVLDLSNAEVSAYLLENLDRLLASQSVAYLKWDHNRTLVAAAGADGRAAYHRQIVSLYALIDALGARHPHVEIESCAAGGGRIDAGIATRTHRFWTSDNLDGLSRLEIQRGFLAFMPPETMGAHVGQSPSHTTGRRQSLSFRAAVALPGHFGVELDPADLGEAERDQLAEWIALYKRLRDRLHSGRTWLGEAGDGLCWQAVGEPNDLVLFLYRSAPARGASGSAGASTDVR